MKIDLDDFMKSKKKVEEDYKNKVDIFVANGEPMDKAKFKALMDQINEYTTLLEECDECIL